MTLTENDIREGLSYAYFHAVATRAGFPCQATARTIDATAVDVFVKAFERLAPDSTLTDIVAQFQVKATSAAPVLNDGQYSFRIEREQYDKLRQPAGVHAIPLVVMFLPIDSAQWLVHDEESLVSRRCAYWVSLRNAPAVDTTKPTIYIPKQNVFNAASLRLLMTRFSRLEEVNYGG
jgi:hypothetical protein